MTSYPSFTETEYTGWYKKSFTTLKDYTNLYRGLTQRFELNCHNVAKHSKSDARGTVVPNTATASAPAVENEVTTFTGTECACCVFWFEETESATQIQRKFCA
jgi:hypothetical protein